MSQVLFYCHYPDMLLASRGSRMRQLYRAPIDWLEELSTGAADQVVVNSEFTRGVEARVLGFQGTLAKTLNREPLLPWLGAGRG